MYFNMKGKNNKEHGITIIVLVITIIILIILAGIGIRFAQSGSGILNRSRDSVNRFSVSALNEKIDLAQSKISMDDEIGDEYTVDDLANELKNEDIRVVFVDEESDDGSVTKWVIDDQYYKFTEEDDGTITYENQGKADEADIEKYEKKNTLRNLSTKAIKFVNDPEGWTNKSVKVTFNITDETIAQEVSKGTYYIVSCLNDITELKKLTKPVTEQIATDNEDVVYVCLTDGKGKYSARVKEKITNIDKVAPSKTAPTAVATTNTITVTSKQDDLYGSGIKNVEYSNDGGTTWQTSNIFTNLIQNKEYKIATRATDNAGNVAVSRAISVSTGTIAEIGSATISPTGWTKEDVAVTLPTLNGFTTVYTTNGKEPTANSTKYTGSFTIGNNCTIMFAYTDGTNLNKYGTITISKIDKTAPTNTAPSTTNTTNSITVTSRQADNAGTNEQASGIKTVQYQIKKNSDTTWGDLQASGTFSNLVQNTKYDVRTKVTDNAGNVTTSEITTVTTGTIGAVGTASISPATWTNGNVTVTLPKSDGFKTMYTTDGTTPTAKASTTTKEYSSPFEVSSNCTIMYVYTDGNNINTAGTISVKKIDKTAPTNTAPTATYTTNSITVTSRQADNAGTNEQASGIKTVQYQIKKNSDTTWGDLQSSGTFSNLVQNTKYDVRTKATDNAGNATTSEITTVTTGTIGAVGTASISPTGWTNGNVTVTLPKSDGFKTMYTTDGTTPTAKASTTTKEYSSPFEVSSNCTIMYVYTDGNNINTAGTISVQKIDKTAPTNTAPSTTNTTNSITVTSRQADNAGTNEQASGIKTVQYQIKKNSDTTWGDLQSSGTFSNLVQNTKYDVRTKVTDNAGNVTTSEITTVTTGTIGAVGTASISPTGWTNGNVTVTLPKSDGFTTMYTTDGTTPTAKASTTTKEYSSPFEVSSNCTIMYVYTDGNNINTAGTISVQKIDKTAPTNTAPTATYTTNSITVTSRQADNAGTNEQASGIKTVQYQIKKNSDTTWGDLQSSGTFSNLVQNTKYDVRTQVTDNAGNTTTSAVTTVVTGTIGAVGTASISPATWTNGNVTVTLPKSDGFKTMYTTDGTTPTARASTTTKEYSSPFEVSSNCTIMYVYTDGNNINTAGTISVQKIDKTAPTNTAPSTTNTTNSITVTSRQADNAGTNEQASGIKTVQYQIKKNADTTWGALQSSGTFSNLVQNTKYDVRTKVTDNAGNVTTSEITTVTTGTIGAVGTASISPTGWTNGNVTVTLPKSDGFTTMYTTDGTTPTARASTTTKEYSSPFEVSSNCTIMYVYTDGTNINTAGTISVQKIDKTAPTNTAPSTTNTTNSITVTSRQADNAGTNEQASGIKTVQYQIKKNSDTTWGALQSTGKFGNLIQNTKYDVRSQVTDNAGNTTTSEIYNSSNRNNRSSRNSKHKPSNSNKWKCNSNITNSIRIYYNVYNRWKKPTATTVKNIQEHLQ